MVQALSVAITLLRVSVQPAPDILKCPAPGFYLKPGRFCRAWSSQAPSPTTYLRVQSATEKGNQSVRWKLEAPPDVIGEVGSCGEFGRESTCPLVLQVFQWCSQRWSARYAVVGALLQQWIRFFPCPARIGRRFQPSTARLSTVASQRPFDTCSQSSHRDPPIIASLGGSRPV